MAPTNDVYAVTSDGDVRQVEAFHWGLVPMWAKDPRQNAKMINAGQDAGHQERLKPAAKRRRCLIPADGFYEWKKVGGAKRKQPYYITRPDGEPFAFAGLWEVWQGPKDEDGNRTGDPLPRPPSSPPPQRDDGGDPRPHAGDPAAFGLGRLARPRQRRRRGAGQAAGARPAHPDPAPARVDRGQQRAEQGRPAHRAGPRPSWWARAGSPGPQENPAQEAATSSEWQVAQRRPQPVGGVVEGRLAGRVVGLGEGQVGLAVDGDEVQVAVASARPIMPMRAGENARICARPAACRATSIRWAASSASRSIQWSTSSIAPPARARARWGRW